MMQATRPKQESNNASSVRDNQQQGRDSSNPPPATEAVVAGVSVWPVAPTGTLSSRQRVNATDLPFAPSASPAFWMQSQGHSSVPISQYIEPVPRARAPVSAQDQAAVDSPAESKEEPSRQFLVDQPVADTRPLRERLHNLYLDPQSKAPDQPVAMHSLPNPYARATAILEGRSEHLQPAVVASSLEPSAPPMPASLAAAIEAHSRAPISYSSSDYNRALEILNNFSEPSAPLAPAHLLAAQRTEVQSNQIAESRSMLQPAGAEEKKTAPESLADSLASIRDVSTKVAIQQNVLKQRTKLLSEVNKIREETQYNLAATDLSIEEELSRMRGLETPLKAIQDSSQLEARKQEQEEKIKTSQQAQELLTLQKQFYHSAITLYKRACYLIDRDIKEDWMTNDSINGVPLEEFQRAEKGFSLDSYDNLLVPAELEVAMANFHGILYHYLAQQSYSSADRQVAQSGPPVLSRITNYSTVTLETAGPVLSEAMGVLISSPSSTLNDYKKLTASLRNVIEVLNDTSSTQELLQEQFKTIYDISYEVYSRFSK